MRWSKDGNQNRTDYSYDQKGNLIEVDPPAGSGIGATTYAYDPISRPETITDGKGQKRKYAYDALDRIEKVEFFEPGATTPTPTPTTQTATARSARTPPARRPTPTTSSTA